jgi:hypothetical protein
VRKPLISVSGFFHNGEQLSALETETHECHALPLDSRDSSNIRLQMPNAVEGETIGNLTIPAVLDYRVKTWPA